MSGLGRPEGSGGPGRVRGGGVIGRRLPPTKNSRLIFTFRVNPLAAQGWDSGVGWVV